ncbi:dihydropteroate synthase [Amaricoccus solimangrovi]|uniref:Dihydropteroate synthase n=2 Tax=Amaricoccus solimangrovi TaxID=2589815 RepID=A0A501WRY0_9RHOB|nr:dihydropteroate synthase [Amaricoccus solimangrovi]
MVAEHRPGHPVRLVPVSELGAPVRARLSAPRAPLLGLSLDRPRIMGVLNVTPDSFSDGGRFLARADAVARARALIAAGADILDIGGESTRPGAETVSVADEIARVVPVIEALREEGIAAPISIDTRKAEVARAAITAGADLLNDVSALEYDPASLDLVAGTGVSVCLMHAKGDPRTMQEAPAYDDVLAEVHAYLAARVEACLAAGVPRARILVDPGIGFGKTAAHNLALIDGLAAFHDLGCAVLLGVSRKRFIGAIGHAPSPADRMPGSIAAALQGLRRGAQVLRVHDVAETRQAALLWTAIEEGGAGG